MVLDGWSLNLTTLVKPGRSVHEGRHLEQNIILGNLIYSSLLQHAPRSFGQSSLLESCGSIPVFKRW